MKERPYHANEIPTSVVAYSSNLTPRTGVRFAIGTMPIPAAFNSRMLLLSQDINWHLIRRLGHVAAGSLISFKQKQMSLMLGCTVRMMRAFFYCAGRKGYHISMKRWKFQSSSMMALRFEPEHTSFHNTDRKGM